MEVLLGIAMLIGSIAAFVYVIDTLGTLKDGQKAILQAIARLEASKEDQSQRAAT